MIEPYVMDTSDDRCCLLYNCNWLFCGPRSCRVCSCISSEINSGIPSCNRPLVVLDAEALGSSRRHPIHSFSVLSRKPYPPRVIRRPRASAVPCPPCAPQILEHDLPPKRCHLDVLAPHLHEVFKVGNP